jgi:hypothetical protein
MASPVDFGAGSQRRKHYTFLPPAAPVQVVEETKAESAAVAASGEFSGTTGVPAARQRIEHRPVLD